MLASLICSQWLAERARGAAARRKLLSRVHLLFAPASDGVRSVSLGTAADGRQTVVATATNASPPRYSLVVVDEAHHIHRDAGFWAVLDALPTDRKMLLSE